jgi:DNA mismatch endonuclease, patch repair protein
MTSGRVRELLDIVGDPPGPTTHGARAVMQGNRRRDSAAERGLRSEMHRIGLRFRVDYPVRVDGHRLLRPDVVFTKARVAVFVDGCFWHGCPQHGTSPSSNARYWAAKIELNQARDARQSAALVAGGWTVVRIWEHEPAGEAALRVKRALDRYAARATGAVSSARLTAPATALASGGGTALPT